MSIDKNNWGENPTNIISKQTSTEQLEKDTKEKISINLWSFFLLRWERVLWFPIMFHIDLKDTKDLNEMINVDPSVLNIYFEDFSLHQAISYNNYWKLTDIIKKKPDNKIIIKISTSDENAENWDALKLVNKLNNYLKENNSDVIFFVANV